MTAIQGLLALGVQDIYQPAQGYRFPSIALKEVPHLLCLREDRVQLVHHHLTDLTLADQPHHFLESIPVHISTGESVVDEGDHLFFPFLGSNHHLQYSIWVSQLVLFSRSTDLRA